MDSNTDEVVACDDIQLVHIHEHDCNKDKTTEYAMYINVIYIRYYSKYIINQVNQLKKLQNQVKSM